MRIVATCDPGRINFSGRIDPKSNSASGAVALDARHENAATIARSFGVQRDVGADGVDPAVGHLWAAAEHVYRLAVWKRHGGGCFHGGFSTAGYDRGFSGGRSSFDHV